MVRLLKALAVAAACLAAPVVAHPGEKHDWHVLKREIHARDAAAAAGKRSLGGCENTIPARELARRNVARRAHTVQKLRKKRGITSAPQKYRRDLAALEKWEAINHNQTDAYRLGMINGYDAESIFGANTSCILTPTVTDGPYYVWGEVVRQNVKEEEYSDGIDVHLEVQYIDINTCRPIPGAIVDIWQANATGVYSGISTSGNYAADGYDSTYLRGIQQSNQEGVVSFDTIFPGHYDGRATHTHLLTHLNATLLPNKTLEIGSGAITHIGQLFWNEVLRSAVEETSPYTSNTQAITTNAEDMWSVLQADSSYDPFPEYAYLGDSLDDGLFAWIQIGINSTADYVNDDYYNIAAYHDANGGYANDDAAGSMPSGGGNGTAPPS